MLLKESYWFRKTIEKNAPEGSSVIIIGSSTKTFREKVQPHIYENVYKPLEAKACKIINVDLKKEEGVDLSGDITNPEFIAELKRLNADFVICSNLLEHIVDRNIFISSLSALLNEGGKLIISVPYSYPYHSDPIDTLYRPTIKQLVNDLKDFIFVEGEIVTSGKLYNSWYNKYPYFKRLFLFLRDWVRAVLKLKLKKMNLIKWLFVEISATCCILKKI